MVEFRVKSREEELDNLLEKMLAETEKEKAAVRGKLNKMKTLSAAIAVNRARWDEATFRKVVPQPYNCEHPRTKAWGNEYGNGERCRVCGKEVSNLFLEENQEKGWGLATDPALNEALIRHRADEATFKFTSGAQLVAVEGERRRLEKERREIFESEAYFYDFDGLRVTYEFDRRHRSEIKEQGIFRQGLQWNQEDLKKLGIDNEKRERARLLKEVVFFSSCVPLSPFVFPTPPPPFPAYTPNNTTLHF